METNHRAFVVGRGARSGGVRSIEYVATCPTCGLLGNADEASYAAALAANHRAQAMCDHCHGEPPRGHTCPSCGGVAYERWA